MKIERLYTLSQFVDLVCLLPENELSTPVSLDLIHYYNEFLKQPLKKEIESNIIDNLYDSNGMWRYKPCKTVGELAEATNGQLKLKNVEI